MTDGSGDGVRPRPRYGEYATPEEQQARIQQPAPEWAVPTPQTPPPEPVAPVTPAAVAVPAAAPAAPAPRSRVIDRRVTIGLLILGLLNVITTAGRYFDLSSVLGEAMDTLGVPGGFTAVAEAQTWGAVAGVVFIVGYAATALVSWLQLRAGRVSWWIPLVGAVVTYAIVMTCMMIPILFDPAFIAYVGSL